MKFSSFVLLVAELVAVSFVSTCLADGLFKCDGVWRSKPCSSQQVSTSRPTSPEDKEQERLRRLLKDKNYLVLQLDLLRFNAAKELGVELSISPVSVLCKAEETSLEHCGTLVSKRQSEIEAMLVKHRAGLRDEAKQERENKNDRSTGDNDSVNQTVVTVVRPVSPSPWIHGLPRCCQDTCRLAEACQLGEGYYNPTYDHGHHRPRPQPPLSPGFRYPPAGGETPPSNRTTSIPPSADPRHFPYGNLPEYRTGR